MLGESDEFRKLRRAIDKEHATVQNADALVRFVRVRAASKLRTTDTIELQIALIINRNYVIGERALAFCDRHGLSALETRQW